MIGEVRSIHGRRTRNRRALVEAVVDDGSSLLNVTFFNQAWREKQLAVGTEVSLFGKLDVYRGKRQMTMPVVDVLGRAGVADDKTGVILPVYPQSGKAEVFTWQLGARSSRRSPSAGRGRIRRPGRPAGDIEAQARRPERRDARDPPARVDVRAA